MKSSMPTPLLLDGLSLSREVKAELLPRIAALRDQSITPCLAVILVGEDAASQIYVRHKIADCGEVGIESRPYYPPSTASEADLLALIATLNADSTVHGILLQLPLPPSIDSDRLLDAIDPAKDVDGFHPQNAGALAQGRPGFWPCTPYGVMRLLAKAEIDLTGLDAVVVGRSNIVGKPMALMLLAAGCTVSICHSKTRQLSDHLARADLVVAAVGKPKMISGDALKEGVIIVDVGINRLTSGDERGKLCGDVDFASAAAKARAITPVPGGVGPMTRAMLLENTVTAAERLLRRSRV